MTKRDVFPKDILNMSIMKKINFKELGICLLITILPGVIGSFFTASNIPTWYASLYKPSFNPPNYVFGPVWTMLYFLMGISLYLVFKTAPKSSHIVKERKLFLVLFIVQLVLNMFWSIIFFGMRSPWFALLDIVALWFLIIGTLMTSWKVSKPAFWLLVPYILWVSFATVLNYFIAFMN